MNAGNATDLVVSSFLGIARGVFVHSVIYPVEVVKVRYQCSPGDPKISEIALRIFQQEGIGAFYKGLAPQLLKTSFKQVWCWPMITGMPSVFKDNRVGDLGQQALTGLSIATFDAATSIHLDRAKIVSAFTGTSKFCFKNAYKEGWKGFSTHWSKLSVNWVTFLTAQKYLRDQSSSTRPLPLLEVTKIGIQVALIVSLASAPFDLVNTLKQAQNTPFSQVLRRYGFFKLYRGWPLSALSLVIHNIASIFLIEKLTKKTIES